MTFKMSDEAQVITIFNLRSDTNEFIGKGDVYIPAHTGLPAYCTDIEPPEGADNKVAVFDSDNNSWSLIEDHRGQTVYSTEDGTAIYISELGPLPDNVTELSPDGEYQKWDGKKWIVDGDAKKAAQMREADERKAQLLQVASESIAPLQDAVDLDIATDDEDASLTVWKKYRVLLNRIDTSKASDIAWPEIPA